MIEKGYSSTLPFSNHLPEVEFCLPVSVNITYYHRISEKVDMRIQLPSIKSDNEETCKHVKQCYFSLIFLDNYFSPKNKMFMLIFNDFIIVRFRSINIFKDSQFV